MAEMDDEHVSVIRHHNRVLRKVNKSLRSTHKKIQEQADENFLQILEVKSDAEIALEKLWTLGGFECGPSDYDFIVESCVRALNPIDQS